MYVLTTHDCISILRHHDIVGSRRMNYFLMVLPDLADRQSLRLSEPIYEI
jgi:hypothetical protein